MGTSVADLSVTREGDLLADNFLFYGKKTTVAVLENKFSTSMKLGDDVQQFTDFSDLDAPVDPSMIVSPNDQINRMLQESGQGGETIAEASTPSEATLPEEPTSQTAIQSIPESGEQLAHGKLTKSGDDGWAQATPDSTIQQSVAEGFNDLDAVPAQVTTPSSKPVQASTAPISASAQKKAPEKDYSGYALIVDTFASEKTAERAVRHFAKTYENKIPGMVIYHEKVGDSYLVLARGFKTKAEIAQYAKLFISKPMLISIE